MTKRDQQLQEQRVKLAKTRSCVYFAMTFLDAYLETNKDREHEDKGNELYFDKIRESETELDNVRAYLDQKIEAINKKLRDNFIKRMLKKEKKDERKE